MGAAVALILALAVGSYGYHTGSEEGFTKPSTMRCLEAATTQADRNECMWKKADAKKD